MAFCSSMSNETVAAARSHALTEMSLRISGRVFAEMWGRSVACVAIGIFMSVSAVARATMEGNQKAVLYRLIQQLIDAPYLSRSVVERLTGAKLSLVSRDVFDFYEARNVKLKGATIDLIDYREPSRVGRAVRGPFFATTLGGACIHKSEIFSLYRHLAITDVPRGHSLDEETAFSKAEPWGRVSFGFSERSPDCLKSVVFAVASPEAK